MHWKIAKLFKKAKTVKIFFNKVKFERLHNDKTETEKVRKNTAKNWMKYCEIAYK